ncbi:MAG: CaiB/BaiF CoA transferase family protein [Magnetospiraceae bacterium]
MRPLEGLLVITLEQAVAAPYCTAKLVEAGARVIKVERAEGDFARNYDAAAKGESSYFTWLNQGKESLTLNIVDAEDNALLRRLIGKADILVQNFAPGVLDRLGFESDKLVDLNPRLITCNITGYGTDPAILQKRGYDLLVQAESGLISVSGAAGAPGRVGVSVCDIGTGMAAYSGILEALFARDRTGVGSTVDISLFDMIAEWMSVPYLHARYGAGAPLPVGLRHPSIAPYGAFACHDGRYVLLSIQNEREWVRLCDQVLGAPGMATDPRFASNNKRVENRDALEAAMAEITKRMTAAEFQAKLEEAKIACGALNTVEDLMTHPALHTHTIGNSTGAPLRLPAPPVHHSFAENADAPGRTPRIGEHSDAIRREFADD